VFFLFKRRHEPLLDEWVLASPLKSRESESHLSSSNVSFPQTVFKKKIALAPATTLPRHRSEDYDDLWDDLGMSLNEDDDLNVFRGNLNDGNDDYEDDDDVMRKYCPRTPSFKDRRTKNGLGRFIIDTDDDCDDDFNDNNDDRAYGSRDRTRVEGIQNGDGSGSTSSAGRLLKELKGLWRADNVGLSERGMRQRRGRMDNGQMASRQTKRTRYEGSRGTDLEMESENVDPGFEENDDEDDEDYIDVRNHNWEKSSGKNVRRRMQRARKVESEEENFMDEIGEPLGTSEADEHASHSSRSSSPSVHSFASNDSEQSSDDDDVWEPSVSHKRAEGGGKDVKKRKTSGVDFDELF
jgi:hypothetical protein